MEKHDCFCHHKTKYRKRSEEPAQKENEKKRMKIEGDC